MEPGKGGVKDLLDEIESPAAKQKQPRKREAESIDLDIRW